MLEIVNSLEQPAPRDHAELTAPSNDQLLAKLAQSVESRHRHRNKQKVVYALYYVVCCSFLVLTLAAPYTLPTRVLPLGVQIAYFAFVFAFTAFLNWSNQRFYRRTALQRDAVIRELARRGDERALGPLLELMDMRMSVSSKNWGLSRAAFIEALGMLLARLTPATFADLSDAQIHQLSPLLLLPEPELRAIISATLCRCGDARALRSLRKYESLSRMQRLQKYNPCLMMMKAWLRKRNMPTLDNEAIAEVTRCCAAIQPRVEAEQRMAQLLRASDEGEAQSSDHLLRGAMPATPSEAAEQLLRPDTILIAGEELPAPAQENAGRPIYSVLPQVSVPPSETADTVEIKAL